jgi:hypothetical protein
MTTAAIDAFRSSVKATAKPAAVKKSAKPATARRATKKVAKEA